ncbi:hypothetical protein ACFFQF_05020 [Haladaptatus pallidirubidus]|uniref:hypothetical protein n=1 Tax=Haladaptatus pallidirubidus TaxID=1008152 RepID=UPI0035EA2245
MISLGKSLRQPEYSDYRYEDDEYGRESGKRDCETRRGFCHTRWNRASINPAYNSSSPRLNSNVTPTTGKEINRQTRILLRIFSLTPY